MRRKPSLLVAGLVAGATISITAGSPAYACHDVNTGTGPDPVIGYACSTIHTPPDPGSLIQHYYNVVGDIVTGVVCDLWECP